MNCLSGLPSDATGSQTQNLTASANFSQFSGSLQADTVLDNALGPTGLLTGGTVTAVTGATTFNVAAGTGVLTFPTSISSRTVTWSSFTSVSILGPGIFNTFVAIDADGNLVLKPDFPFTAEQRRQYIVLANVSHANQVNVDYVLMIPNILYNSEQTVVDLAAAIGTINLSGNVFSAAANDLTVQKGSGSFFGIGINADTDVRNPNVKESSADSPCLLYKFARNGGVYDVSTSVDNTSWDDNTGSPFPVVPPNKFTIQRFWIGGTLCGVSLGQTVYDTMADAQAALLTDPYSSLQSPDLVLVSYLIIRRGTQDLSDPTDAKFIPAGKFGTGGSGSAGGTGNVNGPASAIAGQIATFADTSGKLITNSTLNINGIDIQSPTTTGYVRVDNDEVQIYAGTGGLIVTAGNTQIVTPVLRLPTSTSFPSGVRVNADMFFQSTTNTLHVYNNGFWHVFNGSSYVNPIMTSDTTTTPLGDFVSTASSVYSGDFPAWKAFNRSPAEFSTSGGIPGWGSSAGSFVGGEAVTTSGKFGYDPSTKQEWVMLEFPVDFFITTVKLKDRSDTGGYTPRDFTILVSRDNITWKEMVKVVGYVPTVNYQETEWKIYELAKYVGISITKNNGLDSVTVNELFIKGY